MKTNKHVLLGFLSGALFMFCTLLTVSILGDFGILLNSGLALGKLVLFLSIGFLLVILMLSFYLLYLAFRGDKIGKKDKPKKSKEKKV